MITAQEMARSIVNMFKGGSDLGDIVHLLKVWELEIATEAISKYKEEAGVDDGGGQG